MIVQWDPGIKKSRPGWSDNHNFAKRALILVAVRRLMKTKPSQPGPDKSSQKLHGDQFLGGKWNHLIEFKTTHVKAWSIYSIAQYHQYVQVRARMSDDQETNWLMRRSGVLLLINTHGCRSDLIEQRDPKESAIKQGREKLSMVVRAKLLQYKSNLFFSLRTIYS